MNSLLGFIRGHLFIIGFIVLVVIWFFGTNPARQTAGTVQEDFRTLGYRNAAVSTPWFTFGQPETLTVSFDLPGGKESVVGDYDIAAGYFKSHTSYGSNVHKEVKVNVTPLMAAAKKGDTARVANILADGDRSQPALSGFKIMLAVSLALENNNFDVAGVILESFGGERIRDEVGIGTLNGLLKRASGAQGANGVVKRLRELGATLPE